MNSEHEKRIYINCLKFGVDIDYKRRLTLCDLRQHKHCEVIKRRYQVHYNEFEKEFSYLYQDINDAVDKFIELKRKAKKWN